MYEENAKRKGYKSFTRAGVLQSYQPMIDLAVQHGWPRERAEIFWLLAPRKTVLAEALRHDSPYVAAATYALSDVIFTTRKESKALPPPLYCHLHGGQASLTSDDLGWAALEQPDRTGFRGLTCSALVLGTCFPNQFTETGYRLGSAQGGAFKWSSPYDSDVVCFESAAEDTHGVHAADIVSEDQGAFPPNTLFRLKSIDEKGSWKAPNGVWPQQRRLIVTATFRAPSDAHISATGSRWTTAYDAEEAALSEDELSRRRQTDHLW